MNQVHGSWVLVFGLDLWKAEYRPGFFFNFFPKFLVFVVFHVGTTIHFEKSSNMPKIWQELKSIYTHFPHDSGRAGHVY